MKMELGGEMRMLGCEVERNEILGERMCTYKACLGVS